MISKKEKFQEQGFCILENIYTTEQTKHLYKNISTNIEKCARELNCTSQDYLRNVSRWALPSPVTDSIHSLAETYLKRVSSHFAGENVKLAKMNVISKSAFANKPVPCHQDIAYSREYPYEFSLWLALHDVSLKEGPLEVLPRSHLDRIEPAVDFWEPNFIDKMFLSTNWQKNAISLPVNAGDAIIFDSRVWHRSARNESGLDRFAIVTRWSSINYHPPAEIPEKIPASFGMWNCGELTKLLLEQGLFYCFRLNATLDLETCIYLWQEKLSKSLSLPFSIDFPEVKKALNDLLILHLATKQHNGGDAQGTVYSHLWHIFLQPLSQWIDQYKGNQI